MAKEWTDEEIQAEIKKNFEIVREDRERKAYLELHERFKPQEGEDKGGSNPPPKKEKGEEGEPPKTKKSLWWGNYENGD